MLEDFSTWPATNLRIPQSPWTTPDRGHSPLPNVLHIRSDDPSLDPGFHGWPTPLPSPRFSVIRYPERLVEIVELRRTAYDAANKFGPGIEETIETEKSDPRNAQAHLVIAEESDQIIASVRLTPPLPGPLFHHKCRFDRPVQALPPRSEFLESSWACIHPEHQGRGLFWHLAAHMVWTAHRLGKSYLVGGSATNLWNNWQRCGYRKTGTTYVGALSDTELSVVMLDVEEVLKGRNIAPQFARALQLMKTAAQPVDGSLSDGKPSE